ncbi:asparagine synthase (glutamine-hydrolyzing) [Pseudonocardia abyssalis]|uniref:asparagine synthase (glutamine-hydrolyzing) n=1 Tax=Pseudonocardia abyssalis TaxID=2792008 RepID=A0ABS6USG8_9PSEU|nr:asparagine synthase (glutamine-hydrolyzing) [Pseudonocardia abyssalis]MBW0117014.1 asparagine synthase (glutamine-hydrolyzing) [Pseudonocardia abyssalis]MBW0135205.1 asparagine synthase (glutamine-hydrolyzing) [Pseudonocardia abyssalis]
MCGLLGLLTSEADAPDRVGAVGDAMACARHRGPDESGTWHDADVAFGFNRLAIIDIEHSHQPLHYADGRYTIVFNGEVYNYLELRAELAAEHGAEFATDGDTEAVVAAYHHWGPDAVRRLRGMFAFLIWDSHERVVFGARDPFGIKPLFVASGPAGVAFASEKKSLLALAPALGLDGHGGVAADIDPVALQHYLTLQYVPEPATMHRSVRRVESGSHVTVRPGGEVEHERYFTPVFTGRGPTGPALHSRIADVLRGSVAAHMRADVTVGAFLSGGIDSTAIAVLAKEHNPDLITFTTGFERSGYSEVDVAAETAASIGVRHVVRTVKPDEMMDALPSIVWYLDDPVADPALVPLWFIAREAREHVKVVLSGEGADELFGGYTIYHEPVSLAAFERVPGSLRRLLGRTSVRLPEGMRGKDLLRRGAIPLEQRYYGNARIFRDDQLAGVLRRYDPRRSHTDITEGHYLASRHWDAVARMQHVDLFTWLRGDILVKADKMTMANSLELRVPFLDPEVFEVARELPRSEKLAGGTTKYALRRALADIVPSHVLNRKKLGFPVPIRHWLRDEMYRWACDIVRDSQADHLIDLHAVRALLDAHRDGPIDHSRRIWTLLVFLIWHGIFVEDRIRPAIAEPVHPVRL